MAETPVGRSTVQMTPQNGSTLGSTSFAKMSNALNLWQKKDTIAAVSGGGSSSQTPRPDRDKEKEISALRSQLDQVNSRLSILETKLTRQDHSVNDLGSQLHATAADAHNVLRQIERLAESVELSDSRSYDHQAQIKYLTEQTVQLREHVLNPTQATYWWAIVGWLYMPVLQFVKGMWVVLYPIVATVQHLTIFRPLKPEEEIDDEGLAIPWQAGSLNSTMRSSKSGKGGRSDGTRRPSALDEGPSLLDLLQSGALDPREKKEQ